MKKFEGYQRGINLGGWYSQCDHTKERYDHFVTEEDFKVISGWGLDHVRIPVDYDLVEEADGTYKEEGFAYIQTAIDWCGKYGLNMVLDLHKTYGYSFDKGEQESGFFVEEACQERFYRLWEQFATRFGKYRDRVAFELLNEVTDQSYSDAWNRIADTCIKRIRAIDPTVTILVGGYWNNSAEAVPDIKLSGYDNIVINFHCYDPMIFTHQGAGWVDGMPADFRLAYPATADEYNEKFPLLAFAAMRYKFVTEISGGNNKEYFLRSFKEAIDYAEEKNVALYCGEYGVIDRADDESTVNWYKDIHAALEECGIGRAAWTYRSMSFGLVDECRKNIKDTLITLL